MSRTFNSSYLEGKSDRAFVIRKVMEYGKGTRFRTKPLIQEVQKERDMTDRQIIGVLRRYEGTIVEKRRVQGYKDYEWEVIAVVQ